MKKSKTCAVCNQSIDTENEPYFQIGTKYICDDSVNVECIVIFCGWHRKNDQ